MLHHVRQRCPRAVRASGDGGRACQFARYKSQHDPAVARIAGLLLRASARYRRPPGLGRGGSQSLASSAPRAGGPASYAKIQVLKKGKTPLGGLPHPAPPLKARSLQLLKASKSPQKGWLVILRCPLSGEEQTFRRSPAKSAFDPTTDHGSAGRLQKCPRYPLTDPCGFDILLGAVPP